MNAMTAMTVGELVAERPSRSRIFEKVGIDYCCGGKRTLESAAREASTDLDALLAELAEHPATESDKDWRSESMRALVEHILEAHHRWLKENMPRISVLAAKVARVHGPTHPYLADLQKVYESLRDDMEPHLAKEENILFPPPCDGPRRASWRWAATRWPIWKVRFP